MGNRLDTVVLFQVPDVERILDECAFWDIYYEHCSYFSRQSLRQLFECCRFEVLNLSTNYEAQYLLIEAQAVNSGCRPHHLPKEDVSDLIRKVGNFAKNCPRGIESWRTRLRKIRQEGKRVVIWGAGSKAVAFLTTLGVSDEVEFAIDINPHKNMTYLPGTGHQVMMPAHLKERPPDVVIFMNPIYCQEVKADLENIGLSPEILTP